MADVGTFRIDVEVENPARPGKRAVARSVLVDTGAELSWFPAEVLEALGVKRNNLWRFRQADGAILERWTGTVVISVAGKRAGDEVVFGEPADLVLFGSRSLEDSTSASSLSPNDWWTRVPRRPPRQRRG